MELNRALFESKFAFPKDVQVGTTKKMKEKVLQFGEGNFLRAFVDEMIDQLNENDLFNGSVVVVQPIERGMVDMLNQQDGLYTVLLRGLENGKEVCKKRLVTSISRGLNPYTQFNDYMECAKNPDLRFVVSNTTEAGITYNPNDKLSDKPQISFPGKVTAFLYERFKAFSGDKSKGLVFIPCELIDDNGTMLRKYVFQYAEEWNLGADFMNWLETANMFTNTLVDRIVTGYPKDEAKAMEAQLGYEDKLLNTAEVFHFWVIEYPKMPGAQNLSNELPFQKLGLQVVWTDDVVPYKARKVRILNGSHTISVLAAYLSGKDTVKEMMDDKLFSKYIYEALFEEIIPTILQYLPFDNLKQFADSVFDRFANPYIKHYLLSIALNSVSKYRARVLPSLLAYEKENNALPKHLIFSFAALLAFYRGKEIVEGALIGIRNGAPYEIKDDMLVLETFKNAWANYENSESSIKELVITICKREDFWGADLTKINGFVEAVSETLWGMEQKGVYEQLKTLEA